MIELQRTHRRVASVREAIEGAIKHLETGAMERQLSEAFDGTFGEEPYLQFKITIRRDPSTPDGYAYISNTSIGHDIGKAVRLYGLKGDV